MGWIAAAAGLIALLGGWLVWRRRETEAAGAEPASWSEPAPPEPLPPPAATPDLAPPTPQLESLPPAPIAMRLEARHLSRAMINASLAYRLTLINLSDAPLGPLRIAGDIVSAHASLSAREQLAPADAALAAIFDVPELAPGESISFTGELRLPIASILPIHSGGARMFVPLARFRAEIGNGGTTTQVFVIGQTGEAPGGALRPFALDRGPGIDREIGQRELTPSDIAT
jgi:hypothetical protein